MKTKITPVRLTADTLRILAEIQQQADLPSMAEVIRVATTHYAGALGIDTAPTLTDVEAIALDACRRCASQNGRVCYAWLPGAVADAGVTNQTLVALARKGLLVPDEIAHGGGRRYYTLADGA